MRVFQWAVSVGLSCFTFGCSANSASSISSFDPSVYRAQIHPVTQNVWLISQSPEREWHGNVEVIEQTDGLVVVDTGSNAGDGRHIVSKIRSLSRKPVTAVILTHWHDDHSLGLSEFHKAWPNARLIAASGALEGMEKMMTKRSAFAPDAKFDRAREERFAGYIANHEKRAADVSLPMKDRREASERAATLRYRLEGYKGSYIVRPTELVDTAISIPDATAPIEVKFLGRANSQGDLVIYLPKQKTAIVGDLVVHPVPYGYSSYPKEWVSALRALDAMTFDVMIPGHGKPSEDRLYLRLVQWSIEDVREQVAPLVHDGYSLDEIKARVDYSEHIEKWAPRDPEYWLAGITESAYNEAAGIPNLGGL